MPDPPLTPDTIPPHPAYILAGGRAIRFGGDKARADIQGRPLLAHLADALTRLGCTCTAVARQPDAYADLGLTTIADTATDRGPVQGLLTALVHRLETRGPGWLLLVACDMLPTDDAFFLDVLEHHAQPPETRHAVARRTDRWHPMPGLYHTALLPLAAASLADGQRAFQTLLAKPTARAHTLRSPREPDAMALHINTPHDLPNGPKMRLTPDGPRDQPTG